MKTQSLLKSIFGVAFIAMLLPIASCYAASNVKKGSFTDARDGKTYKTVKIGDWVWMAENLNYNAEGSKCYDDSEANCKKYGRLYNWETATTVCPSGWHLPSGAEWNVLMKFANPSCSDDNNPCANAGTKLKATSGWNTAYRGYIAGTDNYGFSALPGGYGAIGGGFHYIERIGFWWSSSEYIFSNYAYHWNISYDSENVVYHNSVSKGFLHSVRCVQGPPPPKHPSSSSGMLSSSSMAVLSSSSAIAGTSETFSDGRDGKIYRLVKIGTQTWMAENLNYNAKGSKCYDNSEANCKTYGRLYDWKTATTVCPSGWHLPSDAEWYVLVKFANPSCPVNTYCANAGTKLRATSGWDTGRGYIAGTDNYGFSALPGGYGSSGGSFYNVGGFGYWWSASEYSSNYAYSRYMYYYIDDVYYSYDVKSSLRSVRCLQD